MIESALDGAKAAGWISRMIIPRTLPMKLGGALLFLIALFAGLSATGALAGGAANIVKAANQSKSAKAELEEVKRHNKNMEAIAIGKVYGLFL